MKWFFKNDNTDKIKIYDQFKGKNSFIDISRLQHHIGYSLPEAYKRFLSKYNGGRVSPNAFDILSKKLSSSIQFFYGFTEKAIYDLTANYNLWKKSCFPLEYFPIANDEFGNSILIDRRDGRILFWSHDNPEYRSIEISKDFDSFLKSLYEIRIVKTELDIAIEEEDVNYFEKRIANGEHVDDIKNEFGQTIVVRAALEGKLELIKFFIGRGAKMEGTLFKATSNGHYKLVKYLLSLGLDPNERDSEQNDDTALIHAAHGGYIDIVKMLIKAGANINEVDRHGQSVLRKAYWSENQELITYLEKLGAIDSYKNTD